MAVIGSLSVKLGLVTVDWDKATADAKRKAVELRTAVSDLTGGVTNLGQVFKNLGGTMGLSIAGIAALTRSTMGWAGQINDLSVNYDVSISKILQFQSAIVAAGGKTEDAGKIMASMFDKISAAQNGNEEALKTFQDLGITLQDLQTTHPDQMIGKIYAGLANIGNTYDRIAKVKDILGKAGVSKSVLEVAEALGQSDAAFKQNAESIKALDDLGDSLTKTYDNLRLAVSDMFAPFTGHTAGQAIANVNQLKAGLLALGSAFVIGKLMEVARVGVLIYEAYKKGATVMAAATALQGLKGVAQVTAAGVAYYGFSKMLESQEKEAAAAQKQPSGIGTFSKGDISAITDWANTATKQLDVFAVTDKKITKTTKQKEDIKEVAKAVKEIAAAAPAIEDTAAELFNVSEGVAELMRQDEIKRKTFSDGWREAFRAYVNDAKEATNTGGEVFQSVIWNMESSLDNFVRTGKFSFKDFANSVIQDILRIMMRWQMMQIITGIMGSFGASKSPIGGSGISATNFAGGSPMAGVGMAAAGGYIDSPTIVGENGAELFIPNRPGTIIPNARMGDFMNSQPQMVINGTYVANMSAIDTQSAQQFLAKNRTAVFAANQSAMRGLPAGR